MSTVIAEEQQNNSKRGRHPNTRAALKAYDFKPGESGNPGGRPKGQSLTSQLRELLEETDKRTKKEISRLIAEALVRTARKGDVKAFKEIADRTEGKPEQKKTVNEHKTITVIFERPEFANHDTNPAQSAGEDISGVQTLQRAGLRSPLREIVAGAIPVDRDGA